MKGSATGPACVQEKKIDATQKKILKNKKGSAAEAQLVLVVLRMINYGSFKKADGFPIGLKKKMRTSSAQSEGG